MFAPPSHTALIVYVGATVTGLIFLISRCRMHPFLALMLASLSIGVVCGMDFKGIAQSFQDGVASMLGSVAPVIGLGMVLGRLLTESGAAQSVADTLVHQAGGRRLEWTLLLIGFLIGIPVFFTVGLVLLVPIVFSLQRRTSQPLLRLGIPMLAGLSAAHGLIPPHPGPMAAIGLVQADPGKTILYSVLIGLPAAALAGPLFGRFALRRLSDMTVALPERAPASIQSTSAPPFSVALFAILFPVLLILAATISGLFFAQASPIRAWLIFTGHPTVAMLIATLVSLRILGTASGLNRERLLKCTEESLAPAGSLLLVVGAGGGFSRILIASGVGDALAEVGRSSALSPLLLGWLVAALIRIATGSATVAVTTAAGLVAPLALSVPGTSRELFVIATGAGSLILSHVNDGGFWLVKEYLGLTVTQTLKTWTILETILSVTGLILVLLASTLL